MSFFSDLPAHTDQPAYATAPAFPRHVVTAIVVSHDGSRWLPRTLSALLGQERPVQYTVAVDTGSADDSPRLLRDAIGDTAVFAADRRTSFGAAVAQAVRELPRTDASMLPYPIDSPADTGPFDPGLAPGPGSGFDAETAVGRPREVVEWLWLLHDDSEPAANALHMLLRAADELPSAGVLGPKVRSWYNRRQLLEVGTTIARSGRRWTGLERREQDQGQHDAVRGVLSVGSPGMLVRRDVYEALGGFDRRLPFSRDDTDFGWRVNAAGHRVVVVPDAVVQHAEASSRERRPIDCARSTHPHRVDRAGAVFTLLANSGGFLPLLWLRLLFGTILRFLGHLIGKQPRTALDELLGALSVLLLPGRFLLARVSRRRTATTPQSDFKDLFPSRGTTARHAVEGAIAGITRRVDPAMTVGRHSAAESGPVSEDAEAMEAESFTRLRALLQRPGLVLTLALVLITLLAARDLMGSGALQGGALLPPPGGASDLWHRFTETWHGVGPGGDDKAPPYLALVAAVATLLLGKATTAVTVLLIGCVPLAGVSAYLCARSLVPNSTVRAWGAAAYALLPVAGGAVAGGRLGTAMVLVLAPIVARGAVRTVGGGHTTPTWRAVWATALALTLATAAMPLSWIAAAALAVVALVCAALTRTMDRMLPLRLLVALATPLLLLGPWTRTLLSAPSRFLMEPGVAAPGLAERGTSPLGLMLLNPGGPGTPPSWLLIALPVAALAALLRRTRRRAVLSAWAAALTGLLIAVIAGRTSVTVINDGATVAAWPGLATALIGIGYITAAMVGAEDARARVAASSFGWRQPAAVALTVVAALTPLAAAGWWAWKGVSGPVHRAEADRLPAFVASEDRTSDRSRALLLRVDDTGAVSYTVVRGGGQQLGDADIAPPAKSYNRLDAYISNLLSGSGAVDSRDLTGYAVRFVVMQNADKHDQQAVAHTADIAGRLDGTPGLMRTAAEQSTAVWRVQYPTARLSVQQPDGTLLPLPSEAQNASAHIDPGPDGRVLRLAEAADPAWKATLDGHPLTRQTLDGWAQGFVLPAQGGHLELTRVGGAHDRVVLAQGLGLLVVVILALPARRRPTDDDLPESAPTVGPGGEGSRRRRRRAEETGTVGQQTTLAEAPPVPTNAPPTADPVHIEAADDWGPAQYAQGYEPPTGTNIVGDGVPAPRDAGPYDQPAPGHPVFDHVPAQPEGQPYPGPPMPQQPGTPQYGVADPYQQPAYQGYGGAQYGYDGYGNPVPGGGYDSPHTVQDPSAPQYPPPPPTAPPTTPDGDSPVEPTQIWRHGDDQSWPPAPGSRP